MPRAIGDSLTFRVQNFHRCPSILCLTKIVQRCQSWPEKDGNHCASQKQMTNRERGTRASRRQAEPLFHVIVTGQHWRSARLISSFLFFFTLAFSVSLCPCVYAQTCGQEYPYCYCVTFLRYKRTYVPSATTRMITAECAITISTSVVEK